MSDRTERWIVRVCIVTFLLGSIDLARADLAEEKMMKGPAGNETTEPVDFDEIRACTAGTKQGKVCTVDGDCPGGGAGSCRLGWSPMCTITMPSTASRATIPLTCDGNFNVPFKYCNGGASDGNPCQAAGDCPGGTCDADDPAVCLQLRVQPRGPAPAYWRYAGETHGGVELPAGIMSGGIAPVTRLCNSVEIKCTSTELIDVVTP